MSVCRSTLPSCSQHTPGGVDLDKVENTPRTELWCISWKEGRKGRGNKGSSEGTATRVGKSILGDILGAKDETKTMRQRPRSHLVDLSRCRSLTT